MCKEYEIKDNSQKVYKKFVENYRNSKKYNKKINLYFKEHPYENNSILKITFCKLGKLYVGICLLFLFAKIILPYDTFDGFSWKKLLKIYGVIILIFIFLFILSIANIPDKKSIIQADFAMYDTLSCLGIIESEKRIEIIDLLIEDKVGVGDFYIKLFNVVKNNNIIKYFIWLSSIFIGLYTGFINGVFSKNMDKNIDLIEKSFEYIYMLGKQLGIIFIAVLIISSLYYVTIDFSYKQRRSIYDLYFISLNNIKYKLLLEYNEDKSQRNITEEGNPNMSKDNNNSAGGDKVEIKNKHHKNCKMSITFIINIMVILYSALSVIFIFAYYNFPINKKYMSSIIVVFVLISYFLYTVLNIITKFKFFVYKKGKDENSADKENEELSQNVSKKNIIKSSFKLLFAVIVTRLLVYINTNDVPKSCFLIVKKCIPQINFMKILTLIVFIFILFINIRKAFTYYMKTNELYFNDGKKDEISEEEKIKNDQPVKD